MSQFRLVMPVKLRLVLLLVSLDVYLTKLHWNVYILFTVGVMLVGSLCGSESGCIEVLLCRFILQCLWMKHNGCMLLQSGARIWPCLHNNSGDFER